MRRVLALLAALTLAAVCLLGAPFAAAAAPQEDPPVAGQCRDSMILVTIAGSTSCQPAPRVVVTPAPVAPAPEPAPVVEAPPAPAPIVAVPASPVPAPAPAPVTAPAPAEPVTQAPAVPPVPAPVPAGCVFSHSGWICFGARPPVTLLNFLPVPV